MRNLAIILLLTVAGCGSVQPDSPAEPANVIATENPEISNVSAGLEQAAIDSGIVMDTSAVPPTGLYQHTHEGGRDSLCVAPSGKDEYQFGMEAVFGDDTVCTGKGTAKRTGDKLILDFARSKCVIVGSYEGDRISLPGVLDVSCDDLCNNRGSFEGVSFPRVSKEIGAARSVSARGGKKLCAAD